MVHRPSSIVILVGPTAAGKTDLAIALAAALGGEIISADSRQIYRGMDIGTAKATPEQRALVRHHLVDVVNPDQVLTLAEYQHMAFAAITDVRSRGLVPFLTGSASPKQARQYSFCERIPANAKHDRRVLPGTQGSFMVRGHGWKYIRYGGNKPQEFLYRLTDDRGETRNLIAEKKYANQREKLSKELDAWLARTGWPAGNK